MRQERAPQPPLETRMFRDVPMQALADLLKTLPIPITITIGAKTLDEATWAFAVKHILHPGLVRERVTELRGQAQVHVDREAIEKIVAGIKKKMKNLYALAQDATDEDTIDSLKALLHDLERQKREAEAMLFESEEEEESIS